jgi:hypothetical protein
LAATATDTQGHSTTSASITVTVSNTGSTTVSAVFQKLDLATAGNWKGIYGADGEFIANDSSTIPSYAAVTFSNALTYTWISATTDTRALLQNASTSNHIASAYYNYPGFSIDINVTDGKTHQLALYLTDWDYSGRAETIALVNAATKVVLDTRSAADFAAASRYLVWQIQGHVTLQFTCLESYNAVVSGIFFDPVSTATPPTVSLSAPAAGASVTGNVTLSAQATSPAGMGSVQFLLDGNPQSSPVSGAGPAYSTTWASTETLSGTHTLAVTATDTQGHSATSSSITVTVPSATPPAATASYVKLDTTTQGNWKGVYGADGSLIPNDSGHLPGYAIVNQLYAQTYTFADPTTDSRALLTYASTTNRIASVFYNAPSFTFDINLTDGQTHQLALYLNDFDASGRAETMEIVDANSKAVLDTRSVSNFAAAGEYLVWNVSGHIQLLVTRTAGNNAIVNGVFLEP